MTDQLSALTDLRQLLAERHARHQPSATRLGSASEWQRGYAAATGEAMHDIDTAIAPATPVSANTPNGRGIIPARLVGSPASEECAFVGPLPGSLARQFVAVDDMGEFFVAHYDDEWIEVAPPAPAVALAEALGGEIAGTVSGTDWRCVCGIGDRHGGEGALYRHRQNAHPTDPKAERHTKHARNCWCLNDGSVCCVPSCCPADEPGETLADALGAGVGGRVTGDHWSCMCGEAGPGGLLAIHRHRQDAHPLAADEPGEDDPSACDNCGKAMAEHGHMAECQPAPSPVLGTRVGDPVTPQSIPGSKVSYEVGHGRIVSVVLTRRLTGGDGWAVDDDTPLYDGAQWTVAALPEGAETDMSDPTPDLLPSESMALIAGWWDCNTCHWSCLADPSRPAPPCPHCGGADPDA